MMPAIAIATPSHDAVFAEVRAWIDDHAPLTQHAVDAEWRCATWPHMPGGRDLLWDQWDILLAELNRVGAPTPSTGFGQSLVGPALRP